MTVVTPVNQKIAVVTGGSRGIGAAICKRLALDGYHVVVNFSSSRAAAESVCGEITKKGGKATAWGFDVGDLAQIDSAFEAIGKELGPVSVLVNNAGISRDTLLLRIKEDEVDLLLDIDLKGAIFCTRAAAKQMLKARSPGAIVMISSVIGETGNAGQSIYASAKAGLIGFTKSVAKELASRTIRVNCITPGFIGTEMTDALSESQKEGIMKSIPLGEIGLPEDVAGAVSFLVSEDSRYITGQVLGVNGGMRM